MCDYVYALPYIGVGLLLYGRKHKSFNFAHPTMWGTLLAWPVMFVSAAISAYFEMVIEAQDDAAKERLRKEKSESREENEGVK